MAATMHAAWCPAPVLPLGRTSSIVRMVPQVWLCAGCPNAACICLVAGARRHSISYQQESSHATPNSCLRVGVSCRHIAAA